MADVPLKSLQSGDHLMPASHSDRWLQPVLPSAASSRAELTSNYQPPNSPVNSRPVSERRIDFLYSLFADRTENTASSSSFIVACIRCLAMALILLRIYTAVPEKRLFLWFPYSSCHVSYHSLKELPNTVFILLA
jgi:hypothetical protein